MNLKESFRYQKFLDTMLNQARRSLCDPDHILKVTRMHLRNVANPDADNVEEVVELDTPFFPNDDVIRFMEWLVEERQKLSTAIGRAKASVGFDIDAAIDANKFRQIVYGGIKNMLAYNASKSKTQGRDYRFNINGDQTPYYYDIEVTKEEAFDREASRNVMRRMITEADQVSADIDAALINIQVDYVPKFDVNESFNDVMAAFTEEHCS